MKIGNEEFAIQPESKRTMDVEITLFTLLVYAIILTYALGYLSWPLFYLLFHPAYMRVFMGNHDRFHADKSRRWPKPVEWFSETFGVVVTPWDEPYDSIRLKHFQHHLSHLPGKTPDHDTFMDPHAMYEAGGQVLGQLAKDTIEAYIKEGRVIKPPEELTSEMKQRAGVFVSIHKGEELRGCIGTFEPHRPNVAQEIIGNALSAATQDPRFNPASPTKR